jgi:glycosyltransferase involved in cell wall biosynthesis
MKILLIHNKYSQYGGEDSVFYSESELLARNGHFVEQLIFDNKKIKTLKDKILLGFNVLYNFKSARLLKERIQNFHPDVIHIHNFFPQASPSLLFVAKRYHIPVILTLHNYRLICPSATLFFNHRIYENSLQSVFPWDAIRKGVYRNSKVQTAAVAVMTTFHNIIGTWKNKVDQYITLTPFSLQKFKSSMLKVMDNQWVMKPNFAPDLGEGDRKRKNFFLFVGRLVEEKGLNVLLKAATLYKFRLYIIGDGVLKKKVQRMAKVNPNIRYLGFLNRNKIIEVLKRCKALIFPSVLYEGLPLTIIEAFSTGTPVIASNIGAMAEVVDNEINGLLFETGDERELARKVVEMQFYSTSPYFYENARKTYLKNYTPERNYRMLMNIYKEAIRKKMKSFLRL